MLLQYRDLQAPISSSAAVAAAAVAKQRPYARVIVTREQWRELQLECACIKLQSSLLTTLPELREKCAANCHNTTTVAATISTGNHNNKNNERQLLAELYLRVVPRPKHTGRLEELRAKARGDGGLSSPAELMELIGLEVFHEHYELIKHEFQGWAGFGNNHIVKTSIMC